MAFKETKKSGQYYRVFTGESNGVKSFDRYSFVTDASDVIFDDGTTAEDKFGGSGSIANINKEIEELKKSVSDGKKKVATAITDKGVSTAADATFDTMANNITIMGNNQYNAGVTAADNRVNTGSNNYKSGYNTGYNEGYNQGTSNVKNDYAPNGRTVSVVLSGKDSSINQHFYTPGYSSVTISLSRIIDGTTYEFSNCSFTAWSDKTNKEGTGNISDINFSTQNNKSYTLPLDENGLWGMYCAIDRDGDWTKDELKLGISFRFSK